MVTAPVRGYAAAPIGGGTWTGFYAGMNLGLSIGRSPTARHSEFATSTVVLSDTFTMSPFGAVGGGQLGYNWQFAPN